jgi:hypothetical protein
MSTLGKKPELKWIKLAELYIDHKYQRSADGGASKANLKYMREYFSWAACGALIVCHMPDKKQYAVIDGQHRFRAAKMRDDIKELPCVVIDGQDVREQAQSFVAINTKRVALHSLSAYHAAIVAGDPDALAVSDIVKKCGIEIPRSPVQGGTTGPQQTQAIATIQMLLRNYNEKHVKFALTILSEAFPEKRSLMRSNILKALAEFSSMLPPAATRQSAMQALQVSDIEKLEHDARASVRVAGGVVYKIMAEAMIRNLKTLSRRPAA